jgi:hypothetical protein
MAICIEGVEQFDYGFSSGGCFPLKFCLEYGQKREPDPELGLCPGECDLEYRCQGGPPKRELSRWSPPEDPSVIRAEESDPGPVSLLCDHSP